MIFHVLTLFPEIFPPYLSAGILGKGIEKKIIQVHLHQLRDYATDKHRSVDDRPYGGGSGMVLRPDVVVRAVEAIRSANEIDRVVLLSPRGRLFSDGIARQWTGQNLLLICGRYEGIDQRAIDKVVDEELSIGDYVLTGGELPALVVVDAVSRFIPGVVGNEAGPKDDSHTTGFLEYPHYTRPEEFEGRKVPSVLLSGNHAEIEKWRREQALLITQKNRPDLLQKK